MGKEFGAVYLILGTCIAAGMLGLPVVTAGNHYGLTVLMILSGWALMTTGAYCLVRVNIAMPAGANIISMSEKTLGPVFKFITWFAYLLQLYALICAYLAGSGDLLNAFFHSVHLNLPRFVSTLLATVILGAVVYRGIRSVDLVNRVLMSSKILICLFLIISVTPFVHLQSLHLGAWHWHFAAWLVVVTSFGYGNILPSVRDYLENDRRKLVRAVMIGGLAPMILYLIWIAVIQGALPHTGTGGLLAMNNSPNTNSMLMGAIIKLTHKKVIQSLSVVFISICSVTGFLSVSLSLMDVLADGLKRKKEGWNKVFVAVLALCPPFVIVTLDPAIFTRALAYAGVCCIYVLAVLPMLMFLSMKRKGMC